MDAIWTATSAEDGLLPEARHRLAAVSVALDRMRHETAWECRAAVDYRESLDELIRLVDNVRDVAFALELDLRVVWQRAAMAGAW